MVAEARSRLLWGAITRLMASLTTCGTSGQHVPGVGNVNMGGAWDGAGKFPRVGCRRERVRRR